MTDTPLGQRIRRLIAANGPISVADYMALCLGDPEHGYYMNGDPFGPAGDFVTAPEVSQIFGEIVGAWLIHCWQLAGAPSPVRLTELGPGRGTLMADILRVAARTPAFRRAATIHLVETSPVLRAKQRLALAGHEITWHASFTEVPEGALLLVANEFFDALPIRQFVRVEGKWRERVIGVDASGVLAFGIGAGQLDAGPDAAEGAILEICPAADALIADIAHRIARDGVAALIADYGHAQSAPGETFQAVRAHSYTDPLAAPGRADLTAHVDFAALARRANAEGAVAYGPVPQGDFLVALGLRERAAQLCGGAEPKTRHAVQAAVSRLAAPDQMGALFKILAVTQSGAAPPPFGGAAP